MPHIDPRDRLIVALDLPTVAEAEAMVARIGDAATFYKIGLELTFGGGLALAQRLVADGKKVFLDLKFHDIGTTVEKATAQVAGLGATFLTVHAFPQTMRAAAKGKGGHPLRVLGVTVLTSYDENDLREAGYALSIKDLVQRRALQAREAGLGGLVMSPEEVADMRRLLGPDMIIVTPGIRPASAARGDQKRVMTPAEAIRAGADHLVVGRPITQAADPRAAAQEIVDEIATAL